MALKISKNVGLSDIVSPDATNPITTQHDIAGGVQSVQLWLFNDNAAKRYTTVTVDPIDLTAPDEAMWVQLAPDNAGVAGTYLSGGVALTLADVNDSNVPKPFWAKITTPSVGDTQNKTDIKLRVTATEFAV